MEELFIELVENGINILILESCRLKYMDCFVEQEVNGIKYIFIKYGVDFSVVCRVFCKEINQLIGCYIDNESWLYLVVILECKFFDSIFFVLDNVGVFYDVEVDNILYLEFDFGLEVFEEFY